jgi:NAD-dependent dihydropyrimidine dehydrogenase PreA subunit
LTYVICEPCVDVLDRACVEECPVDCIYESGNQLWIHPQECVDCDACMPVCPVDAIFPADDVPAEWRSFTQTAEEFFTQHPDASGGASQSPYAPQMEG